MNVQILHGLPEVKTVPQRCGNTELLERIWQIKHVEWIPVKLTTNLLGHCGRKAVELARMKCESHDAA